MPRRHIKLAFPGSYFLVHPVQVVEIGNVPMDGSHVAADFGNGLIQIRLSAARNVDVGSHLPQRAETHPSRHGVRSPRQEGQTVQLQVRDWGSGFDPDRAREGAAAGERVEVAGMRERLVLLGGRLQVRSRDGLGTTIRATLPRPEPRDANSR